MINVGIFGFGNVAKALVENSALFENSCKVSKYSALLLLNSSIITFFN